ncbi:MAG: TPM domain-containing protein [Bacteroidales bacterium]|nr:TPM domain-containing protein [Bacteroidales bacterium]
MKAHIIKVVGLFFFLFFSLATLCAQDIPARPDPPKLVNDFAGVLSPGETEQLERKLVAFNDSTSTQIVVVLVKSLNGYDKNDFAYRIGQSWGVGQKGKNNGAVILVKPKYRNDPGEASIQIAYGLEGVIPDAIAKRIVENEMIPNFLNDNYYKGINAAVSTMISLTKGEFTADQYAAHTKKKSSPYAMLIPLIILAIVFLMIRSSRARNYSVGKNLPFWTAFWLLGSMGHGHSGSWNDFSSGSGGFGGGGGGFGGFGGGSFGGGGAGGSW